MIRLLEEKDLDAFIRVRLNGLRLFPASFGASFEDGVDRESFRQVLATKHERNFIMGAFEKDNLVGLVGFVQHKSPKMKHKGIIWGVYVEPDYGGQGIGRQLLNACLDRITHFPELHSVQLTVSTKAPKAKALYESLGFEPWGIEPECLLVGGELIDEIHMWKKLG